MICPIPLTSIEKAVGAGSTTFGAAMIAGQVYLFMSSTACWVAQGATPTASAGAGSMFVPASTPVYVCGEAGADAAVIQDAAGGKASLTRCFVT